MILKRFYNDQLAQASFLIGCAKTKEAIVIDPNRDIDQYLRSAAENSLRIVAVTETHIHADFVSGSRELASKASAKLYLSDEGDQEWKYRFAGEPNVALVRDGDSIPIGTLRFDVVRTPGHTPEHISFIVSEQTGEQAAFTGDFIFVGEVGRPDLLERVAGFEGTMAAGAKTLFSSLQKFSGSYPETLTLWPGHGAGSSCGKNLSSLPNSSLGQEKRTNWALKIGDERAFVETVLSGQPVPPRYFKRMKAINRDGPKILGEAAALSEIGIDALEALLANGAQVVDLRLAAQAARGFIPGVLSIPLNKSFVTWAGWLLSYDAPIYFISPDAALAAQAAKNLSLIGFDNVIGWCSSANLTGGKAEEILGIDSPSVNSIIADGKTTVLDVRNADEFAAGHIPGALHIPLGDLDIRWKELPKDKPILVYCQGGSRSSIAYTVLRRHGLRELMNFGGGYGAFSRIPPSPEPK